MDTRKTLSILCQELIDIIVDYFHDDYTTLISCSLTSRLFLPSSRFHLFKRLYISPSQWTPFFDLLKSPLSTITHVQYIKIDFEDGGPHLLSILTRLQSLHLRSLTLKHIRIKDYTDFDLEIAGFIGLKELTITRSNLFSPSNLFKIISKFTSVKHVRLTRIDYDRKLRLARTSPDDHHLMVHNSALPMCKTFEYQGWSDPAEITITWLIMQPDISSLRAIVLTDLMSEDLVSVGNLLRVLGPQLEYLELQLPGDSYSMLTCPYVRPSCRRKLLPLPDHIEKCFDLSINNKLQCIYIILPVFIGCLRRIQATECKVFTIFALILSQIRSPSLREVILSKGPETQREVIDVALLPAIVSALKGKQFVHMQRLVFPALKGDFHKCAEDYLKTALSEWDDRGVLVFEDIRGYLHRWTYELNSDW
jgi:hypothetical protein